MNILVLGGTRYFGIHMVKALINRGHQVTIATRGRTKDDFGDQVSRIIVERTSQESIAQAFNGKSYDIVCDDLAYCSNDVKYLLDNVSCKRYVMVSTTAVYDKHMDTKETEYNPIINKLRWCSRSEFAYDEIKRQAECALFQQYKQQQAVAVRFPFVIGKDDYTKRLYFYVEYIIKGVPMFVDNLEEQMGFIRSDEAGRFLAFLAEQAYTGPINGSSFGTMSIKEIITYVENKTGKKAILSEDGEKAPYNGEKAYSINTEKAVQLGFGFTILEDWIYNLLDEYIETVLQ
jgi:nucleoside-diphosphate-sugar epimerase